MLSLKEQRLPPGHYAVVTLSQALQAAQEAITEGAVINGGDGSFSPLYTAARHNNVSIINMLLDGGADINLALTATKTTPSRPRRGSRRSRRPTSSYRAAQWGSDSAGNSSSSSSSTPGRPYKLMRSDTIMKR